MEPLVDQAVRLALNAALLQLTESWDEKAARLVVRHCHGFPKMGIIGGESIETTRRDNTPVQGYTREHGNVPISTSTTETREHSFGIHKARVGQFRVYRVKDGVIEFHSFWKSSLTTMSSDGERPPIYRLGYNQKTLEPLFLAVWDEKPVFSIPFTHTTIICYFLVPIHGEVIGWKKVFGLKTIIVR